MKLTKIKKYLDNFCTPYKKSSSRVAGKSKILLLKTEKGGLLPGLYTT